MPVSKTPHTTSLSDKIASAPRRHDNDYPLWQGPCASGPLGGITQSMLVRFLSCRERFRLKYVLGLEPPDRWVKTIGYGNMWHTCEEYHAAGYELAANSWQAALIKHFDEQAARYPMQREEIVKWFNVCCVQFPEYVKHWAEHPDVINRTPLEQEKVFDVRYLLPSGRVVRLRGKRDSSDLIRDPDQPQGIYLQENKTKGDIDKQQVERQLKFDLQTMLYLITLRTRYDEMGWAAMGTLNGVRYNVVRRPLSGGIGNIKPHAAKFTKTTAKPAESNDEFYERLRRDYIADDPGYWFFRVRTEVSTRDIQVFKDTCLSPLLETVCSWYEQITGKWDDSQDMLGRMIVQGRGMKTAGMNYRTPFGVWSALEEGGSTEYDSFLENGSESGLRRVETLFGELQE